MKIVICEYEKIEVDINGLEDFCLKNSQEEVFADFTSDAEDSLIMRKGLEYKIALQIDPVKYDEYEIMTVSSRDFDFADEFCNVVVDTAMELESLEMVTDSVTITVWCNWAKSIAFIDSLK